MEGKPEIIDFSYAIRGTLLPTMLSHKAHKHRCTVRTLQKGENPKSTHWPNTLQRGSSIT